MKEKVEFSAEGYGFGFDDLDDILDGMLLSEDILMDGIESYLMDEYDEAVEMTEGVDYDSEEFPPRRMKVKVTVEIEDA